MNLCSFVSQVSVVSCIHDTVQFQVVSQSIIAVVLVFMLCVPDTVMFASHFIIAVMLVFVTSNMEDTVHFCFTVHHRLMLVFVTSYVHDSVQFSFKIRHRHGAGVRGVMYS